MWKSLFLLFGVRLSANIGACKAAAAYAGSTSQWLASNWNRFTGEDPNGVTESSIQMKFPYIEESRRASFAPGQFLARRLAERNALDLFVQKPMMPGQSAPCYEEKLEILGKLAQTPLANDYHFYCYANDRELAMVLHNRNNAYYVGTINQVAKMSPKDRLNNYKLLCDYMLKIQDLGGQFVEPLPGEGSYTWSKAPEQFHLSMADLHKTDPDKYGTANAPRPRPSVQSRARNDKNPKSAVSDKKYAPANASSSFLLVKIAMVEAKAASENNGFEPAFCQTSAYKMLMKYAKQVESYKAPAPSLFTCFDVISKAVTKMENWKP